MKFYTLLALLFMIMITYDGAAQNTLTKKEKKDGWKLLFDGKTTTGWRKFNSNEIGSAWKVDQGALFFDNSVTDREERGDIVTHEEYENFELVLDWKIDSCGNSGIMFNVVEDPKYRAPYLTGPEMQVLDNDCHPDAKIDKHRAGDLYDLIRCSKETVKPAGQWNQVKIVSNKAHYEFWLNGTRIVEFTMHTPEWDALVAGSKFKQWPDFGKATRGHLCLQDHGDKVWFRNIKIKMLK
ncbi:MAG: 3-keto-disaccharide hydrolase [Bacteroidota bacterium]